MEIFIIIIAIIIAILGIIGTFVPVLPGPPLSFLSLFIYKLGVNSGAVLSNSLIWGMLIAAVIVTVFDFIAPMIVTKKFGGSSLASKLSMVGMILGVLFFPPLGIILGPFIGAFVGELIYNRKAKDALKIASLAFISFLITTGLKFIYSIITIFILIKSVIESTFMS